jgi:3-oxoacyl-[acyl-carrier-protein] synthase III
MTGSGSAVPATFLDNQSLTELVETSDDWITTRTGIRQRRLAKPSETLAELATAASRQAIAVAGINPQDLDFYWQPLLLMTCLALLVKFRLN